jgi:hypothetical protein
MNMVDALAYTVRVGACNFRFRVPERSLGGSG